MKKRQKKKNNKLCGTFAIVNFEDCHGLKAVICTANKKIHEFIVAKKEVVQIVADNRVGIYLSYIPYTDGKATGNIILRDK
jgi:hypothetical protein